MHPSLPPRPPAFGGKSGRPRTRLALLLLLSLAGCRTRDKGGAAASPCGPDSQEQLSRLDELRRRETPRYRRALAQATTWLDELVVDPVALGRRGFLGKRKLGDILSTYHQLLKVSERAQEGKLRQRAAELLRPTASPDYHDLARLDDQRFNEESSDYLFVAYLAERLGQDTRDYRKQLGAIKPRLDAQLPARGPQVRELFHTYYDYFGWSWPLPTDKPKRSWIVTRKPDPRTLTVPDAYRLTHEVFIVYHDVDRPERDGFADPEAAYLRNALPRLTRAALRKNKTDITAELLACLHLTRAFDVPVFVEGLAHLLDTQLPSGAWGQYAETRQRDGPTAEQLVQLHTTEVAIMALTLAFHEPWYRGLSPRCPPAR